MKSSSLILGLVTVLTWPLATSAVQVKFEFITGALSADDMSPDGRFIVGSSSSDGSPFPDGLYHWDRELGVMIDLPAPGQSAVGVSDDGSVVVGDIPDPTGVGSNVAGRWTEATGWESLGHLPNAGACPSRSDSYEISGDGATIVGLSWDGCSGRGFIWTADDGMLELQNLANGNNRASVVSSDGTVIGGFAQGSFSRTPAVWDKDTTGELLDPPNGDDVGEVHGIRDDGSVLLGAIADSSGAPLAAKWTATMSGWEHEQIASGSLLPGWQGIAMDIADDDTVVGFDILLGNRRGWIQPEGQGPLIDLRTYFESNGATVPAGLIIEVPQAISTDGHFVVGHGFGTGAWIATITSDCDFNADLTCDIADIDDLIMAIATGSTDTLYDLTGDGNVDLEDRDAWLAQAGAENLASGNAYLLGDANLDGAVDGNDFIVWNANKFSATGLWSLADFDADGFTNGSDFILWNANKFQSADAMSTVPEPAVTSTILLLAACVFGSVRARKQ